MDKMLQTFKKHLGGLDNIEEVMLNSAPKSKVQIHRFGEGIKAANELIGCLQVLNSKLNKLQTIVSKIEFSLEDDQNNPANVNMVEILIAQAKDLVANTRFIDKELFDVELGVQLGSHNIAFEMPTPMPFLETRDFTALNQYVDAKKEEITACMEAIKAISEGNSSTDVSMNNLRGKTI